MIQINSIKTDNDIQTVAALAHEIWYQHYIPIIGGAQVDYMLEKYQSSQAIAHAIRCQGYQYYLVSVQDRPVGYFGICVIGDVLFLSKIYIQRDNRGQGIGHRMVDFVKSHARENACIKIELTVNKNNESAIAAYEKMGFCRDKQITADIGGGYVMDDYLMVLKLL